MILHRNKKFYFKDLLQFELPSNLLPKNKCLWAIQEGTEEQDFWLIGRPFFKQYCLAIDLPNKKIDFPEIKEVENGQKKN
jgi:ribosomal 30S subunit maturation factor RimM